MAQNGPSKRQNGVLGRLISPEGAEHIRNYKYHGQDLSLTYKYFLSPLAEKCLIFVPRVSACKPCYRVFTLQNLYLPQYHS
jgi:hypothetical protein